MLNWLWFCKNIHMLYRFSQFMLKNLTGSHIQYQVIFPLKFLLPFFGFRNNQGRWKIHLFYNPLFIYFKRFYLTEGESVSMPKSGGVGEEGRGRSRSLLSGPRSQDLSWSQEPNPLNHSGIPTFKSFKRPTGVSVRL